MIRFFITTILLLVFINSTFAVGEYEEDLNKRQGIYLNYYDLVELNKTANPHGYLLQKLEKQLNTSITKQPPLLSDTSINADLIRVASWNIERGFNINRILEMPLIALDPKTNEKLKEELNVFLNSSIIILNEVDMGVPRTDYKNIIEEFANKFKMGYVFGTEFLEVDPYQLGIKKFTKEERSFLEEEALKRLDNINKDKFFGLHGNAILSKYPILNAKIIRLPDCYNGYLEELNKLSALEFARRGAAKTIFSSKVLTELRHGGRMAVVADLQLPNKQIITVVGTHLENRCIPERRLKQFDFLLRRLRNIRNPLIIAGDFNTTSTDASPVSVKKEVLKRVKDPEFIAKQAILSLTPFTLVQNVVINTVNKIRQFEDPTTKNIPLILPNKERKIFDLIKEFKFNDNDTFDIRGESERSYGRSGFLSNSNERDLKGFKPTFELERHFGVAKYKLDWIFVKPLNLKNSNNKKDSHAYAPRFGRTLSLINKSYEQISDHDPICVDIPAY